MSGEHIRSIPSRTMLTVLREQGGRRGRIELESDFTGTPMSTGRLPPNEPRHGNLRKNPGSFNVADHVYRKRTKEKQRSTLPAPEGGEIALEVEVHEDYGVERKLVVISLLSGIKFANAPVHKGSEDYYDPNSKVFYFPVGYNNAEALLIFAIHGDIFESQVVPKKTGVMPFFSKETLIPQLTKTHDPTSMTVYQRNQLVVMSFDRL